MGFATTSKSSSTRLSTSETTIGTGGGGHEFHDGISVNDRLHSGRSRQRYLGNEKERLSALKELRHPVGSSVAIDQIQDVAGDVSRRCVRRNRRAPSRRGRTERPSYGASHPPT